MPYCREAHQLSHDAREEQRQEADGCEDHQARRGDHPPLD